MTFSKNNLSKPEGFNNGADNLYDPYDFLGQGIKSGKSLAYGAKKQPSANKHRRNDDSL